MIEEVLAELRAQIEDSAGKLKKELARVRTGRASPALLDGVLVDYYGTRSALNTLATVNAPEARLLVVTPFDKSALGEVEKAIKAANLGLNPLNDGKVIRIPIPDLTEERRREFVKFVRKVGEEFRVSMRNHRRDANEMLKVLLAEKTITEDESRTAHDKVQALTNEGIERIDKTIKAKEDEILVI